DRWRADLQMVTDLEEVRLEQFAMADRQADLGGAVLLYRDAFHRYGLDVKALDPDDAAERLRASAIKDRLVPPLDEWALIEAREDPPSTRKMLLVAGRADPDPWRNRFREAAQRAGWKTMKNLARDRDLLAQPASTLLLLGYGL